MLTKWNTKSKLFQNKEGNSTTVELLKCIEIGLYSIVKAYIKAKQLRTLETVVRSRIHNVSFDDFKSGFGYSNYVFFHQKYC